MTDVETHALVRLTRSGTQVLVDRSAMEAARTAFERDHCLRLRELFAPSFLRSLPVPVDKASFHDNPHAGLKTEMAMQENASLALMMFCANDPAFLALVGEVTGVLPDSFTGRVYRMVPGMGHHDGWHDDWHDQRVLALSVNVGSDPYEGGGLLLRRRESGQMLASATNSGYGDAILFRLDPSLEHRVDDVVGSAAKTAFAGWFLRGKDFASIIRTATG